MPTAVRAQLSFDTSLCAQETATPIENVFISPEISPVLGPASSQGGISEAALPGTERSTGAQAVLPQACEPVSRVPLAAEAGVVDVTCPQPGRK